MLNKEYIGIVFPFSLLRTNKQWSLVVWRQTPTRGWTLDPTECTILLVVGSK